MKKKTINDKIFKVVLNFLPNYRYNFLNIKNHIRSFVKESAKEIKKGELVLDAGAGGCQWKKYFLHTKYESTDFEQIFDKRNKDLHTFICNLKNIPKEDNTYDSIINIEVIEHIDEPLKAIKEMYRILKPNGKLYLTTPQSMGVHGYPYNYFNFTRGGLEYLFRKAGFKKFIIKPRGGIFFEIATKVKEIPYYILSQYFLIERKEGTKRKPILKKFHPLALILIPLFISTWLIFQIILPFIINSLDNLDRKKDYTMGYCCKCYKEHTNLKFNGKKKEDLKEKEK